MRFALSTALRLTTLRLTALWLTALSLAACHSGPAYRVHALERAPAVFAPTPSAQPARGLAIRWVARTGPNIALAGANEDTAVVQMGETIELRSMRDGQIARTQTIAPGDATFASDLIVTWPILEPIRAFDTESGAERWTREVHAPLRPFPGAPLIGETRSKIVLSSGISPSQGPEQRSIGVIGIDRASGALAFQREMRDVRRIYGDRDLVFVVSDDRLLALRETDGEPVWEREIAAESQPCLAVRPLVVSGDVVVAASCRTIAVIHRTRGTLHREVALERDLLDLDVAGHVAYAALAGEPNGAVRAIDLRSGRALWQRAIGPAGYWTTVVAIDGAVLALSSDGMLRSLDPVSGQVVASIALGEVQEIAVERDGPFTIVAHTRGARLVAVEPRESPPLRARVRLRVTVFAEGGSQDIAALPNARLIFDGTPATTDANGELERVIETRGAVRVTLDAAEVGRARGTRPLGCFAEPLEIYPQDGEDQTVGITVFCPAPC